MLPVTHGEPETRRQILLYTLALVPVTLTLGPLGAAGPVYWLPATLMGAAFIYYAYRLRRTARVPHAIHLFRFSILYLFCLFAMLAVDALIRTLARGAA